jgi:predicted AAA+ superfamily ATPase
MKRSVRADPVDRPLYLDRIKPFMDAPVVKVLTGLRRSGKSRLLDLAARRLRAHLAGALPSEGRVYVLLDKIQEVSERERLVNSLVAGGRTDLYITGSGATASSDHRHRLQSEKAFQAGCVTP